MTARTPCNGLDSSTIRASRSRARTPWVQRPVFGQQSQDRPICQVAASFDHLPTRTEHVPVDLSRCTCPRAGPEDPSRRAEAHIPDEVTFKTKPELGVEMSSRRAIADGLPAGLVLATARMATTPEFRPARVRCEGLGYAVGLHRTTRCGAWICWDAESVTPWRSGDLADAIGRGGFRRVTWREGTKGKMSSRFATERVVARAGTTVVDPSQREAVWLLMEWPHGEKAATDFTATHVAQANMSRRQLVRRVKQRWRTERVYETPRRAWAGSLRGPVLRG